MKSQAHCWVSLLILASSRNTQAVKKLRYAQTCRMIQESHSWAFIQVKNSNLKDTCTVLFTAALFTVAKTWEQPGCPSPEEGVKRTWCAYTMEHCSSVRKWSNAICSNMSGPEHGHIKWSQSVTEGQVSHAIIYVWNLNQNDAKGSESVSHSVASDSLWPHRLQPTRLLWLGDSLVKNPRVGCQSLLQGSFWPRVWSQVSCLQADSLPLEPRGKPELTYKTKTDS